MHTNENGQTKTKQKKHNRVLMQIECVWEKMIDWRQSCTREFVSDSMANRCRNPTLRVRCAENARIALFFIFFYFYLHRANSRVVIVPHTHNPNFGSCAIYRKLNNILPRTMAVCRSEKKQINR